MKRTIFPRLLRILPCCLLLSLAPDAPAQRAQTTPPQAQHDDEVESVSTTLVTVPVRVSDRAGRFLTDLRREQFRVYEDGVEQEISFFETADKPFTVALLLDMSDSAVLKRDAIQAAARAFVGQLREGDRVMVATFDHDVSVLTAPTDDRRALFEAIDRARTGGGTSFYDAVEEIAGRRLSRVPGRKAVVILTDGVDTTSRATQRAAERAADESNALVYAVQYDTVEAATSSQGGQPVSRVIASTLEPVSVAYRRATLFLRLLAGRTGGRFYQAGSVKRLSESFARIAEELRQQYSLGYYPKNRAGEGQRRKLKVTVDAPGASVHARGAYVYKPRRLSRRGDRRDAVATLDD
ncbi:MAG TPA: VWA domain-containing protein [Pyrinomonadaceae bacterium]|jgi:Ca-activated chloride channel family protein|nr:VWA domain-containing protein [Pyrinomonadaceae bacterium]